MTDLANSISTVDRARLASLMEAETTDFVARHPKSQALHERATKSLLDGVPMNWMVKWAGPFPLYVDEASGRAVLLRRRPRLRRLLPRRHRRDGRPRPARRRSPPSSAQLRRGITHMLPTEDAIWAGEELGRRFGLPYWQFTLSATDANRFALRLARQITGRSKVVVHDHCYHGSVDEAIAVLDEHGQVVPIHGQRRAAGRSPPRRPASSTSTTSTGSSRPSPTATSRPSSSSRP